MSKDSGTVCCPAAAPPPKVAHPVAAKSDYELQGTYESLGGYDKVYVTGPDAAEHAIIVIYDIFGFWDTTQRGSDLLANHLNLTLPHRIFMPDVFRGHAFPPEKDGNKELLGKFFSGTADLQKALPDVIAFAEFLKQKKGFKTVSILGYCWGGKLTLLALSNPRDKPFTAGAVVHPAMISVEDGNDLKTPLAFFPSKDEPKEVIDSIVAAMQKKKFEEGCSYHFYNTVHHGWAAARADLSNPENAKQFNDVYQRLADYFARAACF